MMKRERAVQIVVGAVALVCVPFWYQMSLGLILGFASSELYNRLLEVRVDAILRIGRSSRASLVLTMLGPWISMVVLGLPLVAAFLWPQHVSWIGVAVGLLVSKAALYLTTFAGLGRRPQLAGSLADAQAPRTEALDAD